MKTLSIAPAAAGALFIALNASASHASTTVSVDGVRYNVSTFIGSYDNDGTKFNTASAGGVMPWWGNASLAQQFSVAVGTSLGGTPDFIGSGPFFAYQINSSQNRSYAFNYNTLVSQQRDMFNATASAGERRIFCSRPTTDLRGRCRLRHGSSPAAAPQHQATEALIVGKDGSSAEGAAARSAAPASRKHPPGSPGLIRGRPHPPRRPTMAAHR